MKRYGKLAALVVAALLPLVAMVACSNLKPAVQQSVETAKKVSADAQVVIDQSKAVAATLPSDDPLKAALEQKVAQVQGVKDKADQYIKAASGVVASLDSGSLSPEAAGAISLLPYGSYAVAGFSILAAVLARAKASGTLDDLTAVVKSWEAVGAPLSDAEKAAAAIIQGPKASATVDAIKDSLGVGDSPPVVAAAPAV